jgi:hypothetical protein
LSLIRYDDIIFLNETWAFFYGELAPLKAFHFLKSLLFVMTHYWMDIRHSLFAPLKDAKSFWRKKNTLQIIKQCAKAM